MSMSKPTPSRRQCLHCTELPQKDYSQCEFHRLQENLRQRKRYANLPKREKKAKIAAGTARRKENRKRGLCWNCTSNAEPGRTRCSRHIARDRRYKALHQPRPPSCRECELPRMDGSRWCFTHYLLNEARKAKEQAAHGSRQARWQRRQRAKGLCIECRKKAWRAGFCRKHYKRRCESKQRSRRRN